MRRIELINKASNLALIYLLFNYWVTPLYLLLDKLISDGKLFDNISKYGEIKFIPFYIIDITLVVILINFLSKFNYIKQRSLSKNYIYFFRPKIDNIISISLSLLSVFVYFFSSSDYRYTPVGESTNLFNELNLLRSIMPYLLIVIWFIRGNYPINSSYKKRWYFNTILYASITLLLNSGLGSILEFFAWIHQFLTSMDNKGENLINPFFKYLRNNIKLKRKIGIIPIIFLISLFSLPIIFNQLILFGHRSKVNSVQNLRDLGYDLNLSYYARTYFLQLGFNRPEFYTVYKSPEINSFQRKINRGELIENFKYRLSKFSHSRYLNKGSSPHRTNLKHIANYNFRPSEGTSPGLLASLNYYLDPFTSILIETIFLFSSCIFVASFDRQESNKNELRKFLVVLFILRELLSSPISLLILLDHYIIIPSILLFYFLLEKYFIEKIRIQNEI